MEEKNSIKISLSTVLLIILLIVIIIMGYFIYNLYEDKQTANSKIQNLNNEIARLQNIAYNLKLASGKDKNDTDTSSNISTTYKDDGLIDINTYVFELDSKNKYTIATDFRWITMQNDGGSHTNIYYQIDLDNNIVSKIREGFNANLSGSAKTEKNVVYIRKIDNTIHEKLSSLLSEIISKEDINETNNYHPFTVSSLNIEKNIYNIDTIENINNILKIIDELNS